MTERIRRPHFSANAFLAVANVVYLLLAMSLLTLLGCLPLVLAFALAPGLGFYPVYLLAAALCAPGVAASFAMFRDHPVFLTSARRDAMESLAVAYEPGGDSSSVAPVSSPVSDSTSARHDAIEALASAAGTPAIAVPKAIAVSAADSAVVAASGGTRADGRNPVCPWLPDWIAAPYVPSDVSVAVFRPWAAAYRRVAPHALAVGLTFSLIEFLALYDAQLLMQVAWGQLLVPALLAFAVISVEAELVALNLVVEFPKAKWRSLLRNGYLCGVRRFVMLVVNAVCLGVYVWGLAHSPILVGVLATGVLAFVLWAGVRWQSQPLALAMARESHNRNLIALYD
ncbi:hypothetical protein JS528_10565 [Bifidobacterium sp. MA2]|uniref:Uncharacterized protein n=1 Tax=Bifidobacterium santillanense TaxID=2809028 RepID=A0ABS5USJ0_9BIFI|nr:hypothetical protein [Bifidobacterium santillanense]MBT1173771.1 hypothetical protein [Bifidobacterium santillanense]